MYRNFTNFILVLCLCNISICDQFVMLMNSPNTLDDRNKKISMLAHKIYGKKFEKDIIDFVLDQVLNGPKITQLSQDNMGLYLNSTQEMIDNELLKHYGVSQHETEYINTMKNDREKYGMTYDVYKLLSE